MPDHRARIEFDVIAVQVVGRQDIGDNLHRGQRGGLVFRLSPAPQRLVAALDEYLATSPRRSPAVRRQPPPLHRGRTVPPPIPDSQHRPHV